MQLPDNEKIGCVEDELQQPRSFSVSHAGHLVVENQVNSFAKSDIYTIYTE